MRRFLSSTSDLMMQTRDVVQKPTREQGRYVQRRACRPCLRAGFCILLLSAFCLLPSAFAQMSRKPSPTREPAGVMDKAPDSKKNSLLDISSQADFDSIARVYHQNTPYALPHTMFVIDRRAKNKI